MVRRERAHRKQHFFSYSCKINIPHISHFCSYFWNYTLILFEEFEYGDLAVIISSFVHTTKSVLAILIRIIVLQFLWSNMKIQEIHSFNLATC